MINFLKKIIKQLKIKIIMTLLLKIMIKINNSLKIKMIINIKITKYYINIMRVAKQILFNF